MDFKGRKRERNKRRADAENLASEEWREHMELHNLENRTTGGYISFGSIWGKGEVRKNAFLLETETGQRIPQQSRITAWWPDGSVKWACHTADSALMGKNVTVRANADMPEKEDPFVTLERDGYRVETDFFSVFVPQNGAHCLAEKLVTKKEFRIDRIYPVLILEHRKKREGMPYWGQEDKVCPEYLPVVDSVELEDNGALQAVFCFSGAFEDTAKKKKVMPFRIRMYFGRHTEEIRFVHTFFYTGQEERDFLKGMGIRFDVRLTGRPYERHVKFDTDGSLFHEAAVLLNSSHPRLAASVLERQMQGNLEAYGLQSDEEKATAALPVWDRYLICQDSPSHFAVKKQTEPCCCMLTCRQGYRAAGSMALNGANGGILLGIRDFWEKYPAGLEAAGLAQEMTSCTAWFYSPEADAYDFRHYTTGSYPMTSYEGFAEPGADAYGIAVTSECIMKLVAEVPADECIREFSGRVRKPAVYVGTPEYYKEKGAFGYWSLKKTETQTQRWLEEQLDKAFCFYREEVEKRCWYGLFDYGDFMHTYDPVRHCWRYDMGGFAWQNTELVPTYWLWLYFLRTGREDVFAVAEAMSRHCSEVDVYHLGSMKGLGSRHNVRHWGCSCKEPRISMAGHHRVYYYLTGDFRMEDVFRDVKDADMAVAARAHYKRKGKALYIRSGPDWSSFVSDWMTEYERTLDASYREKIETGIRDLREAPFGLASGPEFEYDTQSGHMGYQGEDDGNGMHLQICMGGPEVWMETADMLENEELKDMLAEHGRFYYLTNEERRQETGGKIYKRGFGYPYFAAALAAYSAARRKDHVLAVKVWQILLQALVAPDAMEGFEAKEYAKSTEGESLLEIPWIKTNFASQWCLNVIVSLDFLAEYLPESLEGVRKMLTGQEERDFHIS